MENRIFPIVPASQMPFTMILVLIFFLIAMMIVFGWIMYWSKNSHIEYDGQKLSIKSGLWGTELSKD